MDSVSKGSCCLAAAVRVWALWARPLIILDQQLCLARGGPRGGIHQPRYQVGAFERAPGTAIQTPTAQTDTDTEQTTVQHCA